MVDFNYLRKHGTEADAIWLATGIFVSIVNIFVSLLNIFSGRRLMAVPRLSRRGGRGAGLPAGAGGGSVTIGRRDEADISLPWDPECSRLHAELELRAGEWTITDDGLSQNGTWVNELRLYGRRRLADGDIVRVGRTLRDVLAARGDRHRPDAGAGRAERHAALLRAAAAHPAGRSAGRCSATARASRRHPMRRSRRLWVSPSRP